MSRKPSVADLVVETDRLQEYRTKTQLKALREQTASMEREIEALHRSLGFFEDLQGATRIKPIKRRERTSGLREATPFVFCSDWHVEEVVKAETVNGLNAYNPKVARERVQRLIKAILWEVALERHAFRITDFVLGLLGDMITGYIHEELMEGNAMSPTQAILFAQELCEQLIDAILSLGIERLVVVCNQGNHGRTTHKTRISTGAYNSYEWLMYQSLKRRYASDKRVEFMISDGNMLYSRIYDFTLRTTHGDAIKFGGGVGGITVPVIKKVNQWNKALHADETAFGHFHTRLTLRGINGNGSLIGYGAYSEFIGAEPEPPAQGMFLFDSRYGKVHPKDLIVVESRKGSR